MKKLKLITAIPMLALLLIALSCSDGIAPSNNEATTDLEASASIKKLKTEGWAHDKLKLQPLENVIVMSLPSRSHGITNAEGKCLFDRHATDTVVVFRREGYESIHAPIKAYSEIVGAMFDDSLKKER